jgi:transitional endoplasmic reticulum ATPase
MASEDTRLRSLQDAVRAAPEEPSLRKVLGRALLERGLFGEAEEEFRAGLRLDARDTEMKIGLAHAFHRAGKLSAALVVVEELADSLGQSPELLMLQARIYFSARDVGRAVQSYRRAVAADPRVGDPELRDALGIDADEESELVDGRLRAAAVERPTDERMPVERPKITFADVGGMEALKEEIRLKIIHPVKHPDLFRAYGKTAGGGILLYGPPGCGKTYLARATAGEVGAGFLAVGIHDVLNMWIGESERNLHEIFETARQYRPCVLFFDEVDALGASRSDLRTSAGRHVINQFLAELDGVESSNEGVLILAATNAPWHVDPAFRRPGRFDRVLFVPPPDSPARAAIFRVHCAGKPLGDVDYERVAARTEGFSGADLKGVVDVAVDTKLRRALDTGTPEPLTTADLLAAGGQTIPTTREWFATARNYVIYANQGGLYDAVRPYLKL